jgi:hypothetical protein
VSGLCFSSLKLSRGSDALGFDTWREIGDVVAGMARQEYDLKLRRYNGRGWRAMFFLSGLSSLTADAGSAWAPSPWEARTRYAGSRHRSLSRAIGPR